MLVKQTKFHKKYLLKLKDEIKDFLNVFKKRYQRFPWKLINKVPSYNNDEIISINGIKFTMKSLIKEMNACNKRLRSKTKPSYFNYILSAYIKDAKNVDGTQLKRVYKSYSQELKKEFKFMKSDLDFCIEGLQKINKYLKENRKIVKESVNIENSQCLIISCFAGVGKNYAIEQLSDMGLRVNSIEKTDKMSNLYKSDIDFIQHIKMMETKSDVLFIPYFLNMEKDYIKGRIDYLLIYPAMNMKNKYIQRFYDIGFTESQISNFSSNWNKMIQDCKNCKIPKNNKKEIYNKNIYALDIVLPLLNNVKDINESGDELFIQEKYLLDEPDIYHNKDKFDSGEINLCFITGQSGSGKSTMASDMSKTGSEWYELDGVLSNWCYTDDNLKEYGDLIYSFFKGPGKGFRYKSKKEWLDDKKWDGTDDLYEKSLVQSFVKYSISYAKSHSNKKIVVEGVQLYGYIKPSEIKDFAVYIKGTSMLKSKIRAAKRDSSDADDGKRGKAFINQFKDNWKHYISNEKDINEYRNYFSKLSESDFQESVFKDTSIILYHGTDIPNLQIIKNNSYNLGKKHDKPRTSSFWFVDYDFAVMFATMTLISNKAKSISSVVDNDMKLLINEKDKNEVEDILKKNFSYVYRKTVSEDIVSHGHSKNFPEYTLDIPVKPDSSYKITYRDMIDSIKFVDELYYKSTIEKYKSGKMTFGAGLGSRISHKLSYRKSLIEVNRDIKKLKSYTEKGDLEMGNSNKREQALNKALEVLENNNRNPKVSKKSREKWISGNPTDFGDSLCIAGLGMEGLEGLCTKVNKEIKSFGAKVSPDEYGTIFISIKESEDIPMTNLYKVVTESGEVVDVRDIMIEMYEHIYDIDDDNEDNLYSEGANIDIINEFMQAKKEYKTLIKESRKLIKKGEFSQANKNLKEIKKLILNYIKKIEKIDEKTISEKVISCIVDFVFLALKLIIIIPLGIIGTVISSNIGIAGTLAGNILSLYIPRFVGCYTVFKENTALIEGMDREIHDANERGDRDNLKFNSFKSKIIGIMVSMEREIDKLIADINKLEKDQKKVKSEADAKSITESAKSDFNAKKLSLYEACSQGLITVEEREMLIREASLDTNLAEDLANIDAEESANEDALSKTEKFNSVKLKIYERCNAGYINVTEREAMIQKAKDIIFESDQDKDNNEALKQAGEEQKKLEKEIQDNASDVAKSAESMVDSE